GRDLTGAIRAIPGGRHAPADPEKARKLANFRGFPADSCWTPSMENSHAAIAELEARLAAEQARADKAEAQVAQLTADASSTDALIASLKLQIEKFRGELFGQRSERKARLLGQLELELEELQAAASED